MLKRFRIQNFKSWCGTGNLAFGSLTGFFGTTYFFLQLMASTPAVPATPSVALQGRWQFQLCEQTIRLPSGEVLEVVRQEPPLAAERFLDVTDRELITTFEYDPEAVAALGRQYYKTTRTYYQEGDSIFVTLPEIPSIAPMPQLIQRLDDHSLVLASVLRSAPGYPATEVTMHYIR